MLSTQQLQEIRQLLEKSQNPLFFFDNDVDGLCSYLILQKGLDRGKGVAIKSFPELNKDYLRKINELNPDAVFILDKPKVSEDFIKGVIEKNIPLIWIDHHEVQVDKKLLKEINYFNSFPSSEPVTYIAYNIFKRKQDLWLAMIGCIGDVFMPDFAESFAKENPELFQSNVSAFDALYTTKIGQIVKMLNFGLKDTTTNVLRLMKLLLKAKTPYDLLEENPQTKQLHNRYNEINKKYKTILEKTELQQDSNKKIIFFSYSGDTSMSSEIANELFFKNKDKIVVVAYRKEDKINISLRGEDVKSLTEKAVQGLENATGGGHERATGCSIRAEDFEKFKKRVEEEVKKR